jgi:hypothetical protein
MAAHRLQYLIFLVLAFFIIMIGLLWKMDLDQARLTEVMRKQSDRNGDQRLSSSEVAAWFSMKLGPKFASPEKLDAFISLFDSNNDSNFDDNELQHIFDAMAELPTSNKTWNSEIEILDSDGNNRQRTAIRVIFLFGLAVVIATLLEIFQAA